MTALERIFAAVYVRAAIATSAIRLLRRYNRKPRRIAVTAGRDRQPNGG